MGKPKKSNLIKGKPAKNVALEKQITEGRVAKTGNRNKVRFRAEESQVIDSKTSQRIISEAYKQEAEVLNISADNFPALGEKKSSFRPKYVKSREKNSQQDDDDANQQIFETDFYDDLKIDAEDEAALEAFKNVSDGRKTKGLQEIIMEKIAEKQSDIKSKLLEGEGSVQIEEIDARVKDLYEGVRDVMKRYRSGKVPKAFKIIPKLRNWEQILFITEPHNWSAAAMFQGTRIFSSVLAPHMAQRFYNLVLLPRIRDDLSEYKRLNVHLYNSLKKALFKPGAFMKGIVLPLLESGDCTLREAIIFGSVIAKNPVPVLHSSACLLKICEMPYSGANSIFIRIFLDKRYALPFRVIDAAVFHFVSFENDRRTMPVLWHQSLLTFVQRYKNDISPEQKDALYGLLRKQKHLKITPETRRELQAGQCRDMEIVDAGRGADFIPDEIPDIELTDYAGEESDVEDMEADEAGDE